MMTQHVHEYLGVQEEFNYMVPLPIKIWAFPFNTIFADLSFCVCAKFDLMQFFKPEIINGKHKNTFMYHNTRLYDLVLRFYYAHVSAFRARNPFYFELSNCIFKKVSVDYQNIKIQFVSTKIHYPPPNQTVPSG